MVGQMIWYYNKKAKTTHLLHDLCTDKKSIYAEDDDILDDAALYEPPPIKQPTRKRKERDENENEPLYCYCRQVSYGEMVACDGEVSPFSLLGVVKQLFQTISLALSI